MLSWKKWQIKEIGRDQLPVNLKRIRPVIKKLYYRGSWDENLFSKSLAVVGSRRITRYGREVVEKFMPDLVANKVTIISGFMFGVDTAAHRECLELGGRTVAVLGGGLDYLYPPENDGLYNEILEKGGAVVSEYEPDFVPSLWSFPQRNRIVAGLSTLGVLVVEAGMKSGSLITIKLGRGQGKSIWAVPGPITSPVSAGVNWLIQENLAKLVTSTNEILSKDKSEFIQESLLEDNLDKIEKKILEELDLGNKSTDELAKRTGLPINEVSMKLTMLSIRDLIEEEAGKYYLIRGRGTSRR